MRGYFEIGIYHTKTGINIGTLWRSAYILGASGIFTVGKRYSKECSDTIKTWRQIPLRHFIDFDDFLSHRPIDCVLIGVEDCGEEMTDYYHPSNCIYLLGAEDHGLPEEILGYCQQVIKIPSIFNISLNVAVAGSIVMYDRLAKIRNQLTIKRYQR